LVNFPVEGLDLEERVGERRIAKTLDLSDEECRKYDIEPSSEPLVYDLCEYHRMTRDYNSANWQTLSTITLVV
jgi:hypothetical protein